MTVDKERLRQALLAELKTERARQLDAANLARDEAVNEESRAESKWDTRGQEAAYLAEGQARLAGQLTASIALIQGMTLADTPAPAPIALGSIVTIDRDGRAMHAFIAPTAGGTEVTLDETVFTTVTPVSPLGRVLINRRQGETVTLAARGRALAHRIVATI